MIAWYYYIHKEPIMMKWESGEVMKLLFKQRLFSWFDSYDIYDESGNTVYVGKGQCLILE